MSMQNPLRRDGADKTAWGDVLTKDETPALVGGFSTVADRVLSGWVQDPAHLAKPVVFELHLGGVSLGRHCANLPDPQLALAQRRPAFNGLRVVLDGIAPGHHECVLREVSTGRILAANINVPPTAVGDGAVQAPSSPLVPNIVRAPSAEASGVPASMAAEAPETADVDRATATALLTGLSRQEVSDLVAAKFKAEDWGLVVALTDDLQHSANPEADHQLLTLRGRALLYLKRFKEAADCLQKCVAANPKRHTPMFYLGVCLARLQRLQAARETLLFCCRLAPGDGRYAVEAARVTARLVNGDFGAIDAQPELLDEAIRLMRTAEKLNPRDFRIKRDLAHLLLQAGATDEGLELLGQAVASAPTNASLHLELSRALARHGRVNEALAAAQRAAALDPLRDGASFACRILERWLDARHQGPFTVAAITTVPDAC